MRNRLYAEEWAPTRFNLSIFRLLGFFVALSLRRRGPAPDRLLHQDRYQHPLEANVLALGVWLVPTTHATTIICSSWNLSYPAALVVFVIALMLTPPTWALLTIFLSLPARLFAAVIRGSRYDGQTWAVQSTMIAIALGSIFFAWPSAIVGWIWMGCVAVNVIAAIICLLLRNNALFLGEPAEEPA